MKDVEIKSRKTRRAIVWFKTNLRLSDNECLAKALAENDEIIPVYCIDDLNFKTTKYGFKKTGKFKAKFLLESLADLNQQLQMIGSSLVVLHGNSELELYKIASQFKVQQIYAEQSFVAEELELAQSVESSLLKVNCKFQYFNTRTLIDDDDLPFGINKLPDVFTAYRKLVEQTLVIKLLIDRPKSIKSPELPPFKLPTLSELNLEEPIIDHRRAIDHIGGAFEAQKRLQHYFYDSMALASYKETRNGLIGATYSTKFSAWLALGCISPREIYYEIKNFENRFGANESTYWLFFELLWRDYFTLVFKKYGNQPFQKYGINGNRQNSSATHEKLTIANWINGKTGIEFVDANMLELKLTGFMSNRGRQNVASYFINELHLDWRYGASYFEQQLIDYDVCSNWGNWAYLAGVGNDPRKNRSFNIEKQALTYDTDFSYRKLWLQKK